MLPLSMVAERRSRSGEGRARTAQGVTGQVQETAMQGVCTQGIRKFHLEHVKPMDLIHKIGTQEYGQSDESGRMD